MPSRLTVILMSVSIGLCLSACSETAVTPDSPFKYSDQVKLGETIRGVLESAESFELFALNPMPIEALPEDQREGEDLHGYLILGGTELEAAEQRRVVEAIYQGIAKSEGMVAGCFNPRHGVRAKAEGKTVELVICFECLQIETYTDGQPSGGVLTVADPGKVLTPILAKHGVMIAK